MKTAMNYIVPLDRQGEVIVVVVHRYDEPQDAWGVHELTRRDATSDDEFTYQDFMMMGLTGGKRHYKFHQHTVGLFRERPEQGSFNPLTRTTAVEAAGWGARPIGEVLMMETTINEIFDFIGKQIIPIEWKKQWAEGDSAILDRVEVWV